MGVIGDFVIDSVIMEKNKIKGFAVYPLYGEKNFKSVRMIMIGASLNKFKTNAHDLFLWNPTNQNQEFYKIIINDVDPNEFPQLQTITDDNVLKIFNQLPIYKPRPGDAT